MYALTGLRWYNYNVNTTETLQQIGFTNNEISIYLYLLDNGPHKGRDLVAATKLEKSSVYKAISSLISQGVITSTGSTRNQVFFCTSIAEVLAKFDEKQHKLEQSKIAFQHIATELERSSAQVYKADAINVFKGSLGVTQYHKELLNHGATHLYTFASTQTQHTVIHSAEYKKMNKWFVPERVSRNIHISVLFDAATMPDHFDVSNASLLKECRQLPYHISMPSVMTVSDYAVFFSTVKQSKFWGIEIKDPTISGLLKSMFSVLWSQGTII